MNFFTTLFILLCIGLALTFAIPVLTFGIILILTVGFFFIWLLPILLIANSDKVTTGEKLAWILAIIFLSWFAWIFYFLLAPIKTKPDHRDYYYYR